MFSIEKEHKKQAFQKIFNLIIRAYLYFSLSSESLAQVQSEHTKIENPLLIFKCLICFYSKYIIYITFIKLFDEVIVSFKQQKLGSKAYVNKNLITYKEKIC